MAITKRLIHDVFLSFHGQDTRNNIISHLNRTLGNANINTFIDSNMPRGDHVSSFLVGAIEISRIAIIVFSPNFPTSTWCLDEVVKILECKHSRGQLVLPVFFHVNPWAVRRQAGLYQPIFAKLEEDFRDDLQKVERWRSALREVADIFGWHITSTVIETEVIQQIIDVVSRSLKMPKEMDVLAAQTGQAQAPMPDAHIINEVLGHRLGYMRGFEYGGLILPDRQAFHDNKVINEGSSSGGATGSCSNCADQIVKLHRMFQEYISWPPSMLYYLYPTYAPLPPPPLAAMRSPPGEMSQQPTTHAPPPYPYQHYSWPPLPPPVVVMYRRPYGFYVI